MSFSSGDISLTNVLYNSQADVSILKKQNEVMISNKGDSSVSTDESESVALSNVSYKKILDTSDINHNQSKLNLLDQSNQSLLKTYNYIGQMKKIVQDFIEKSQNSANEMLQKDTASINAYLAKINEEGQNSETLGKKATNQNPKNNAKVSNELNLKNLSTESLGLGNNVSIKNKEDAKVFLNKINVAQGTVSGQIKQVSAQKNTIAKNINDMINTDSINQSSLSQINSLVQTVVSSLIANPIQGVTAQVSNISEKNSLSLLGVAN